MKEELNTQELQAQEEEKEVKKNNLSLTIILSIMLLVVVALASLFYFQNKKLKSLLFEKEKEEMTESSPVPAPTSKIEESMSDWETYESDYYKIKYPKNYTQDTQMESFVSLRMLGSTQTLGTEIFDGVSISIQLISNYKTLEDYVDKSIEEVDKDGVSQLIETKSQTTVGNNNGLTYIVSGLGKFTHIVFEGENVLVDFSIIVADPQDLGYQETVDQILSTFEFTGEMEINMTPSPVSTPSSEATPSLPTL